MQALLLFLIAVEKSVQIKETENISLRVSLCVCFYVCMRAGAHECVCLCSCVLFVLKINICLWFRIFKYRTFIFVVV